MNRKALIIFGREPQLGRVKTRLAQFMDKADVCRLYKGFIEDTIVVARKVKCDSRFLFYTSTGCAIPYLRKVAKGLELKRQCAGNLGDKMFHASKYCFKLGFQRILIIGTDCLTLTSAELNEAFTLLNEADYVIGPTKDGGYYALGLKELSRTIFSGVRWSGRQVFERTILNCEKENRTFAVLPQKEDIDTLDNLCRFAANTNNWAKAKNTFQLLKEVNLQYLG